DHNGDDFDLYDLSASENAHYTNLPSFISSANSFKSIEKEFANYLYHEKLLTLYKVSSLKLESQPEESFRQFKIRVTDKVREEQDEAIEKLRLKFNKKRASLETKYQRALERLEKEEADVSARTTDTVLSFGMTILDAFLGRKSVKRSTASRAGSTIRNARKIYSEKDDVAVAERKVVEIEAQMETLAESLEEEINLLEEEFDIDNYTIEEFYIKPRRSDIHDVEVVLLWESRA
ncbi:MAG: hypothetical protein K0U47_03415, partial [Epsilonproteobacteria bacterium]|nr:hypothetical protein [Campylobacterota bacterium]